MLEEQGYTQSRVKNSFKNGRTYKGVNSILKTTSGDPFELQFHTPSSYFLKENELHKIYEEYRISDNKETQAQLEKKMIELSSTIKNPNGVENIINFKNGE